MSLSLKIFHFVILYYLEMHSWATIVVTDEEDKKFFTIQKNKLLLTLLQVSFSLQHIHKLSHYLTLWNFITKDFIVKMSYALRRRKFVQDD